MELIAVPKDTLIYRSYKTLESRNGYWFSLNPNETHGYGNITGEFKITKDIKEATLVIVDYISPATEDLEWAKSTINKQAYGNYSINKIINYVNVVGGKKVLLSTNIN